MKKIIALIIAAVSVFALSVCAFGAEAPNKYFIVKPKTEQAREVAAYAAEKGFDGIVLDLYGFEVTDYYDSLSENFGGEIYVMGDSVLLSKLPTEAKILVKSGHLEETVAAFTQKHGKENIAFYLPFEDENALSKAKDFIQKGYVSKVFGEIFYSSYGEYGYENYALELRDELLGCELITVNSLKRVKRASAKGDLFLDAFELNNQFLVNKINGIDFCVSDYSALIADKYSSATALTAFFDSTVLDEHADFSVSKKLSITRPAGGTLTVDTHKYTIFGTSNPDIPLYMNGVEVERISKSGLFAVTVETRKSGQTFTFSQGGSSVSATIALRSGGGSSGTTSNLSSCYPGAATLVKKGETTVKLSCVGPSGGVVSAKIGDKWVNLSQAAYADPGVPAKFTATVDLSGDYPEDEVTLIGKVKYFLSYGGTEKSKESSEGFYYIGDNADFAVRANVELAGVEIEGKEQGLYVTTLRTGCVDYVTEITEDGWYKITTGGYMKPSQFDILTGKTDITANFSSAEKEIGQNYEKLIIKTDNFPSFKGEIKGKALVLTLYNVNYTSLSSINLDSELMRRIVSVDNGDGSMTLNFYATENLWGWDIFTDEEAGTFSVVLKGTPKLSDDPAKPLEGITVTVCAGHGGIDPGALSVAGEKGVNEFQINNANVLMIAENLENLGANVIKLIEYEGKLDTYGRTDPARYAYSDVYICSHANSVAENANANLWCGTYVYYHYDHSAEFAQKLVDYISSYTKRDNEGAEAGYYSVTRLTMCPAVMLEVGFVSNPKEMDSLIDQRDILKTANAVTRAVLEILDN